MGANGLNLIKSFESLKLQCYLDTAKIWTIGYGHACQVRHMHLSLALFLFLRACQQISHSQVAMLVCVHTYTQDNKDLPQYGVVCHGNTCSGSLTREQATAVLSVDVSE